VGRRGTRLWLPDLRAMGPVGMTGGDAVALTDEPVADTLSRRANEMAGTARLLRTLIRRGLPEDAWLSAAALCLALDEGVR
jgi:hypothetical protein